MNEKQQGEIFQLGWDLAKCSPNDTNVCFAAKVAQQLAEKEASLHEKNNKIARLREQVAQEDNEKQQGEIFV